MTMIEEIAASQELKQLVDTYANESDKNNQDYYVNIFTEDCRVRVYFNGELGMDLKNVHDLIAAYKGFGAAKAAVMASARTATWAPATIMGRAVGESTAIWRDWRME